MPKPVYEHQEDIQFDLILHAVPRPAEIGEPSRGYVHVVAELRRMFDLPLKRAAEIPKNLPALLASGPWQELEPKAHMLLNLGCGVELRDKDEEEEPQEEA